MIMGLDTDLVFGLLIERNLDIPEFRGVVFRYSNFINKEFQK